MTHVVGQVTIEDDSATFVWSEGPASFHPYELKGQMFREFMSLASEAREQLSDLVSDYVFDTDKLPADAFKLAEIGHELYLQLFDPGAEQAVHARSVRRWLEDLRRKRSVDTLEIVIEQPWLIPWNVVYDREPDRQVNRP